MLNCSRHNTRFQLLARFVVFAVSFTTLWVASSKTIQLAGAQVVIPGQAALGSGNTIPSFAYFQAIEQMYRGEYRDAERIFQREVRTAVRLA